MADLNATTATAAPTAPGLALCAWRDIPDGGAIEVVLPRPAPMLALRIVLLRREATVTAYENCCPHFSLPLNFHPNEFVTLDAMIVCAHHTAFFRFEDGACVDGPCRGIGLRAVPVGVHGDQVFYTGPHA